MKSIISIFLLERASWTDEKEFKQCHGQTFYYKLGHLDAKQVFYWFVEWPCLGLKILILCWSLQLRFFRAVVPFVLLSLSSLSTQLRALAHARALPFFCAQSGLLIEIEARPRKRRALWASLWRSTFSCWMILRLNPGTIKYLPIFEFF
jgi:hypothetical protein